jgi:membrane protease subunit HflK
MQESEGYRARVVANAEGEASRFNKVLVEYQRAPAVMRDRLYIEAMQQIFASTTKIMVDTKSNNSMIYLPLDKLIAQTAAEAASGVTAPATAATPPSASNEPPLSEGRVDRNRERSLRDRESR